MAKNIRGGGITDEDLELLAELGIEDEAAPEGRYSARQERILAGFEEIERWVSANNRLPENGEERDIFERLYAVRLGRMRESGECRDLLEAFDKRGILSGAVLFEPLPEMSDEELLASLGVEARDEGDVTQLVHVRSRAEIKAAEEVAQRAVCPDFEKWKPLFAVVQNELKNGLRQGVKYQDNAEIKRGDWFIVEGQKAFVAEMGEPFVSDYGRPDRRLRVIYDNATQNELLLRSLQRALNRDKTSRRITEPDDGGNLSLFANDVEEVADDATSSGTIYVLRSNSQEPFILQNRAAIHKIGVTSGNVQNRISNAKADPTFLLADVELVATFRLENIHRNRLEKMLHNFFQPVRLDLEFKDRFNVPFQPKEWFFAPLYAIEQAIDKIVDGTLDQFRYEPETATLKPLEPSDMTKSR